MTNKAIYWIATRGYENELQQSVLSVVRNMPNIPRYLFSPHNLNITGITHFELLPPRSRSLWYIDFTDYMGMAAEYLSHHSQLLYLDVDTYVCVDCSEIFDTLQRFDIATTIAPARTISLTSRYVPPTFAEFNTGVLVYRNNPITRELFAQWLEVYQANPDLYGENDQAPLREVLWANRDFHVGTLPFEYNCRFGFGGQAAGQIKILHGRSGNLERLAQNINADSGIRGWRRGDFE